jgi:diketogulonate reductase-like aldo/keto reductase
MSHIDTAELYRGSEEAIRTALQGIPRKDVFLVSKVLPQNASYRGTLEACDASLQRLGTDHLDAYLLHWWGSEPIEDTMRAMAELADQGKTRWIGVSNLDIDEMEAAQAALGRRHKIACNQILYNLGRRGAEADVIPYCKDRGIAVVAYSPIGGPGGEPAKGKAANVLDAIARKHGKTSRQVALRFLTREEHVFAIPKSENPDHVRENAGGQGWTLAQEDVARLDEAFPVPSQGFLARFR